MTDIRKVLLAIEPHGKKAIVDGVAASWGQCVTYAELTTNQRQIDYLAQSAHESGGFRYVEEIASGRAYEGRHDLGNVQKGDGVKFKGRSIGQITGRDNYRQVSKAFAVDFVAEPKRLADFPYAVLGFAWYWKTHKRLGRSLNDYADLGDFLGETKAINGGTNGLASRQHYRVRAAHAYADLGAALLTRATEERQALKVKTQAATSSLAAGTATVGAPVAHVVNGSDPSVASAVQVATAHPSVWGLALVGLALVGLGVGIFLAARKHSRAIKALETAAQEA